jgi:uncharacterized protein (DUF934 family)
MSTLSFIDPRLDAWHTTEGEDGPLVTLTPADQQLLRLVQWRAIRQQWPAGLRLGVSVPNDADIETLAEDLPRIALVALDFPKWTDGRAYSQAHLLRSRYRFRGLIRAAGDVVVDMVPLLARTGFSEALLRGDQRVATAERLLKDFQATGHYQGDVEATRPVFARAGARE